jgi:hypothetical protein
MGADNIYDRQERRCGAERRRFCYTGCIPERRSGIDRREQADRRKGGRVHDQASHRHDSSSKTGAQQPFNLNE